MEEIYKGWTIKYIEKVDMHYFSAKNNESDDEIEAYNVSDAKKRIDKFYKKIINRIDCFKEERFGLKKVTITSVSEIDKDNKPIGFWVTTPDKIREKIQLTYQTLYKDNDNNKTLFNEIYEHEKQIKQLNSQIYEKKKLLDPLTQDDIIAMQKK